MKLRHTVLLSTAAIAAMSMMPGTALAQSSADPAATTADAAQPAAQPEQPAGQEATPPEAGAPGEIIVTARRRAERALDIPVAVTALGGEQLERYASNSLTAISQQVPSLIVAESQNQVGGSINLRGIGSGISNASTEQSVLINLDGIPIAYGHAVRLGQIDVQRVEVLRGPQALFYGKNSPGGIISLISRDPGDVFEASVRIGYETEAQQRFIEGIVSTPLGSGFGLRLVGYYSEEDGWFQNIGQAVPGFTPGRFADSLNGQDIFLRGTLSYTSPDDRLRSNIRLSYSQRQRDGNGPGAFAQLVLCPRGAAVTSNGLTTDCRLNRFYTDVGFPDDLTALSPRFRDGVPFGETEQLLGSFNVEYDLTDELTLTSVTGWYNMKESSLGSFTFTTIPRAAASNDFEVRQYTHEVRLGSDFDGPFNFLTGFFLQQSELTIAQSFGAILLGSNARALLGDVFYDQNTSAYSFFAQGRFRFSPQLELSAGGRMSFEQKSLSGTSFGLPFQQARPTRDFDDFSPEVTLTYKPATDITIYAAYREGFTSGGFNTAAVALRTSGRPTLPLRDLTFDQMTARGGEVGFRGYAADRQVRFDLTGYYFEYRGLQLSSFDTVSASQTTQNAGSAEVQGVEFSGSFRPRAWQGFELRGNFAYNRARYTDFIGGCFPGQSIAQGCNLRPNAAGVFTSQDQAGQPLFRAPEWVVSFGMTHEHDFSDTLGMSVSFDASYSDEYFTQVEEQPETLQESFWQLNASASLYGGPDRAWQLSLIGRNLTNELYRIAGGAVAFTGTGTGTAVTSPADLWANLGPPRSILLQLTIRSSLFGR